MIADHAAVPYIHCAKAEAKKMTAQKKEANKTKIGFLSKKARQNCLTSKNLCPILIIYRLFRVFIPATAICTRALWYFFSVGSNLYASKYTSRELTQIKMLWLPAQ